MKTLLQLNTSLFSDGGQSSRLAEEFVAQFPQARVIARDLAKNPLPHLDAERFGALLAKPEARTPAQQAVLDESDALLTAELKRSHSPYYYMLGLASNARKRGTPAGNVAAIDWARQAYESSKGPATRLQWGGSYVNYLLELSPQDAAQIEKAAASVIGELEPRPGSYSGRSQISLERLSDRLVKWNKDGSHDAMLKRLNTKLAPTCAAAAPDGADRRACEALFTPGNRA